MVISEKPFGPTLPEELAAKENSRERKRFLAEQRSTAEKKKRMAIVGVPKRLHA